MYTIIISSDSSDCRTLHIDEEMPKTLSTIGYKYGRAESGEVIQVIDGDDETALPHHIVYWDRQHREYRTRPV